MKKEMKKVLVLMLVLGFASMATAAIVLTVDGEIAESSSIYLAPSDYAMIGLYNDGSVPFTYGYLSVEPGGFGSWTGFGEMHSPPAVPGAYAYYFGYSPGWGDSWIIVADYGVNEIGILGEFEFHMEGPGSTTISYFDLYTYEVSTLVIHEIPEPATMLILGLGGLMLRRKQ